MQENQIIIIGGGITGLSAAWQLIQSGMDDFCLLEGSAQTGGKVRTLREDGFVIEEGPDSLIASKPAAMELIRELGLEDDVIQPASKGFYILQNKTLLPAPEGVTGFAPSRLVPFLKSPLFSMSGKLRILAEPLIRPKPLTEDETLGAFIRRRFGAEMLDRYAGPLLSGIYASSAEKLSLMATFPRFKAMEEEYGSITKAMLTGPAAKSSGNSLFYSLKNGLGQLPEKLTAELGEKHIHLNTQVSQIESHSKDGPYTITTESGKTYKAKVLIMALPCHASMKLIRPFMPETADLLKKIPYVSTAVLSMTFKKKDVEHALDGSGFLIPEHENTYISSCTWSSSKWPGRAPDDHVLLRCFFGRLGSEEILECNDKELYKYARIDLESMLGIKNHAIKYYIHRWHKAMPQYLSGHLEKLAQIEAHSHEQPHLFLTGAGYHGLGIPDCILQGRETAKEAKELV